MLQKEINYKKNSCEIECSVIFSLEILSKKWIVPIICSLGQHDVLRFGELSRCIDGITSASLTSSLKELQSLNIVSRIQYNEMPIRVEYSLTKLGKELLPNILNMSQIGLKMQGNNTNFCHCSIEDCVVKAENYLYIHKAKVKKMIENNDNAYITIYKEINKENSDLDAIERLILLIEKILNFETQFGEKLSRLKHIYYVTGKSKSNELFAENSSGVIVLTEFLKEARKQGILVDTLSNEEIIYSIFAFMHGLSSLWEIDRDSYNIVEKNKPIIKNFFEGFRKTPS
ncbi:hypothetical protein AN644_04385 [Candidatus Epulonipiscium fishelsonii]|nr:hypothetical protein AN644_04385 [Epulopiscium sp. SCG-C06WGA-EpuloA1]